MMRGFRLWISALAIVAIGASAYSAGIQSWPPLAKITATGGDSYRTGSDRAGERMSVEEWRYSTAGVLRTDTETVQAAVDAMLASSTIGEIYAPARTYTLTDSINVDFSTATGSFDKRPVINGQGVETLFTLTGQAKALFNITGTTASNAGHIRLRNFRLLGNNTVGSKGIYIDRAAWSRIEGVVVEGFDYNLDLLHVEQSIVESSSFRWGIHGVRLQTDGSVTDPNSIVWLNNAVGSNTKYGLYADRPNSLTIIGGSFSNNGTTSGAADEWGAKINDAGSGYGTVAFIGTEFEGNSGAADLISTQASGKSVAMSIISTAFLRNHASGYTTNNLLIEGASTVALYTLSGNRFFNAGDYVVNAGRPYISKTNTNAVVTDLTANQYASATEAPTWSGNAKLPGLFLNSDTPVSAGQNFRVRNAADKNFYVGGTFSLGTGITLGSINDALASLRPIELRTSQFLTPNLTLDSGTKTATASAGAATLAKSSGKITSEVLSTAAGSTYTLTIANSLVASTDQVYVSVDNGTNTQGIPVVTKVTPGSSSITVIITNMHTSQAFNGTLVVSFALFKV